MKRTARLPLLAAVLALAAPDARADVSDYRHCATLTVAGAADGVSLAHFPVLVRLSPERIGGFDYAQLASPQDGADLRFTDADGNFLAHDIDTWNPQGESLVWVGVPTLEPGATIVARWGNASPAEANDPATVWSDAGYVQVWHFSTGVATDATGRGLALKTSGGFVAATDALLGGCYTNSIAGNKAEDGSWSYLEFPNHDALLDDVAVRTVTGWFRPDENFPYGGTDNIWVVLFSNKNANGDNGFNLLFYNSNLRLYGNNQSSSAGGWGGNIASLGSWMHLGARFRTSEGDVLGRIFRNGDTFKEEATLGDGVSGSSGVVSMGNYGGYHTYGNQPFHGDMDEFRVNKTALSDEWMKEEYATVATDGYLSYGDAAVYVPPYVAFLRSGDSASLPAECGTPDAIFTDAASAVAATVAAKEAGAETATLYVAPGTYLSATPLRATNDVSIIGLGEPSDVTFAGPADASKEWNYRVMTFTGGGLLANVTLRGNLRTGFDPDDGGKTGSWNAPCRHGGTLYLSGDASDAVATVASNVVVREANNGKWNYNEFLGTVAVMGTATLTDSVVEDNQGTGWGAGVYANGNALVRRCVIRRNHVKYPGASKRCYGGGAALFGSAMMVDCLVSDNESDTEGGGVWLELSGSAGGLCHCTVAGNAATNAPGIVVNKNAGKIVNTIVAGNGDGSLADIGTTLSSAATGLSFVNTCFGTEPGDSFPTLARCFVADPLFRDAAGGDNSLRMGSRCIDAASAASPVAGLGATTTWIALNGVPHCHDDPTDTFAGLPDIGCYESLAWSGRPTVVVFR